MKPLTSLCLLFTLILCGCDEQPLLHQLSEQQANEVVAVLQVHNVSAAKSDQGKSGFAIVVDKADFPAAVDLLQKYGLPSAPRVEIGQLFPADALVASPQAERARLLSGIEQRLEQSLATLNNVVTARVQLSYPLGATYDSKSMAPMHAAVILTYHNEANTDLLVSEVKRFIKNSFSDIDYDNVSVIVRPVSDIYRGPTTNASASAKRTWQYWLLPLPIVLGAVVAGTLMYLRRSRMLSDSDKDARDSAGKGASLAPSLPLPVGLGQAKEENA